MSKFERKFKNGDSVTVKSTGKTGTISGYSDKKYSVYISGSVFKYSTKNLEKTSEKVSEKDSKKFKVGDKVKINSKYDSKRHNKIGTIIKHHSLDWWTIQIPGFIGHDGNGDWGIPGNNDKYHVREDELTIISEESLKIGDRVKIKWPGSNSDGKIGTIVKYQGDSWWTVKIPGFDGHSGNVFDGTTDKRYILEKYLTKLPEEKESMKIEVKSTPKTSKTVSYPCFKKGLDHDSVVLFFNETSGITVEGNAGSFRTTRNPKKYGKPLENYSVTFSSIP